MSDHTQLATFECVGDLSDAAIEALAALLLTLDESMDAPIKNQQGKHLADERDRNRTCDQI